MEEEEGRLEKDHPICGTEMNSAVLSTCVHTQPRGDLTESVFSALMVEINERKDALRIRVERLHCLHL